jgi:hypothetical protein
MSASILNATNRPGLFRWLFGGGYQPPVRLAVTLPTVTMATIGREHIGKTLQKLGLVNGPLREVPPSGMTLAPDDPRMFVAWYNEWVESLRDLSSRGLTSTIVPEEFRYTLFDGDRPRATLVTHDLVGQVLTHSSMASPEPQQQTYRSYLLRLGSADILQVVLGCSNGSGRVGERLAADVQLACGYLRKALDECPSYRRVAVAITPAKLDAAFPTEEQAKEALTPDRLRAGLEPLVNIVERSRKVALAAIIPISSFGFGTADPQPAFATGDGPRPGASYLSVDEEEWLLKPGMLPRPFNLTGLCWYALSAGLLVKADDVNRSEREATARLLANDLRDLGAWVVPLNCRGGY